VKRLRHEIEVDQVGDERADVDAPGAERLERVGELLLPEARMTTIL